MEKTKRDKIFTNYTIKLKSQWKWIKIQKISCVKKATPVGSADIAALRRLWPDVIENVKKRRRLTWSLLSASAQILSVDDKTITIAIVNAGARDSFIGI